MVYLTIRSEIAVVAVGHGRRAIVEVADLPKIAGKRWNASQRYAIWRKQLMHRVIMDAPADRFVDHRDGDGLNNRRSNLRLCTHQQNMRNSRRSGGSGSGYRGVYFHRGGRRWAAYLTISGRTKHLGYFDTPEEAARAFDAAAKEHYGEFARLNLN